MTVGSCAEGLSIPDYYCCSRMDDVSSVAVAGRVDWVSVDSGHPVVYQSHYYFHNIILCETQDGRAGIKYLMTVVFTLYTRQVNWQQLWYNIIIMHVYKVKHKLSIKLATLECLLIVPACVLLNKTCIDSNTKLSIHYYVST